MAQLPPFVDLEVFTFARGPFLALIAGHRALPANPRAQPLSLQHARPQPRLPGPPSRPARGPRALLARFRSMSTSDPNSARPRARCLAADGGTWDATHRALFTAHTAARASATHRGGRKSGISSPQCTQRLPFAISLRRPTKGSRRNSALRSTYEIQLRQYRLLSSAAHAPVSAPPHPPQTIDSKEAMIRLWTHECYRVFHDRLITAEDREEFKRIIRDQLNNTFQVQVSKVGARGQTQPPFGRISGVQREPMTSTAALCNTESGLCHLGADLPRAWCGRMTCTRLFPLRITLKNRSCLIPACNEEASNSAMASV